MAHAALVNFLATFSALKSSVNGNPQNVDWMSRERSKVATHVVATWFSWQKLSKLLATSSSKAIDRAPKGFNATYTEYEAKWKDQVDKAFELLVPKLLEIMKRRAENKEETDVEADRPEFDPIRDNPAKLIEDILWLANVYAQEDDELGDEQHKALQAWDWFRETVGLDLREISERWRQLEPTFVPDHVANAYGSSDPRSLYQLLDQAVRAYVFGTSAASIAMCRALTEMVLRMHYGCDGEDLENVIIYAEEKPKYFWMKRLQLHEKRKLANAALHKARPITDESVVMFLRTVKELIERAPTPG